MKKKKINKKKVITTTSFVVGGVCLAISAGVVLNRSKIGQKMKDYIAKRMLESMVRHNDFTYVNKISYNMSTYLSNGYTLEQIEKIAAEAVNYFDNHLPLPKMEVKRV